VDDVDRQDLLKPLAEACQKTGWEVHAYCLMRNHFQVGVRTEFRHTHNRRKLLQAARIRFK
jgi:REP element-mobilizing transposase RayT